MFCSKCGAEMGPQQVSCRQCGLSISTTANVVAAEKRELARFEREIRRLSRYWYLFAGVSAVLGLMGLFAVQTGLLMHVGPWEPWPHPYLWNWAVVGGVGWTLVLLRVGFSLAAGWGLASTADWSRPVTFVAAAIAFLDFPIGVVLAIYTASVLLGKQHGQLYTRLEQSHRTLVTR